MDKINLCIDIGNTSTKAALFKNGVELEYFKPFTLEHVKTLENQYDLTLLVCKTGADKELEDYIKDTHGEGAFLTHLTLLPIELEYDTPETLGRDRIATGVASYYLDKQVTWMVVDLGTCLTIDLVNQGVFKGGLISPGVQMRLKAMNHFTAGLPLVEYDYSINFPGKSTEESLQVGVCQGIMREIEGIIGEANKQFQRLKVVDCSSLQIHFDKEVKNEIFARPKLVLEGLNNIIEYNAKK